MMETKSMTTAYVYHVLRFISTISWWPQRRCILTTHNASQAHNLENYVLLTSNEKENTPSLALLFDMINI
jgi:hypothetical protein